MNSDNHWFRFIITGSVDEYLKYCDCCRKEEERGEMSHAFYNRRPGYQGNEHRGTGPSYNPYDP